MVIDHLQDHVINNKRIEFNKSLSQHPKYKNLKVESKTNFEEIREYDFIILMESSDIISKGQKIILHEKLGIRNSHAHPSPLVLTESKVISFIEDLIDNIVLKIT
jgi:hypothetical protein